MRFNKNSPNLNTMCAFTITVSMKYFSQYVWYVIILLYDIYNNELQTVMSQRLHEINGSQKCSDRVHRMQLVYASARTQELAAFQLLVTLQTNKTLDLCLPILPAFLSCTYLIMTASVVQWSEFLATYTEVSGSIPGATRFSEQQWVWNGAHSAS